jgi:hypothetical protein
MTLRDRLLLRGLRPHVSEGAAVLAMERGVSDALGPMRKVAAVLTDDALLLATPFRARTILTVVPRRDIRSIDRVGHLAVAIVFEDYDRAIQRVVQLNLSRHGDRSCVLSKLTA